MRQPADGREAVDGYGAQELAAAVALALEPDALGAGSITHILETATDSADSSHRSAVCFGCGHNSVFDSSVVVPRVSLCPGCLPSDSWPFFVPRRQPIA